MGVVIGVAIAVGVVALVVFLVVRRAPRQDAGITGFRRHIDALSPAARREVMDRVRTNDERTQEREQ